MIRFVRLTSPLACAIFLLSSSFVPGSLLLTHLDFRSLKFVQFVNILAHARWWPGSHVFGQMGENALTPCGRQEHPARPGKGFHLLPGSKARDFGQSVAEHIDFSLLDEWKDFASFLDKGLPCPAPCLVSGSRPHFLEADQARMIN